MFFRCECGGRIAHQQHLCRSVELALVFSEFLGHFFRDVHDYSEAVNAFRIEAIRLLGLFLEKLATSDNHREFVDEVV